MSAVTVRWLDEPPTDWEAAPDDPPRVDVDDVRREGMPGGGRVVRDRVDDDAYVFIHEPVDVDR